MEFNFLSTYFLLLFTGITEVWCGTSICTYTESSFSHHYSRTLFCEHGCCGEEKHQECCDPPRWNLWIIAALCILGIIALVVIIVIIVAVIKKKNAKKARVNEADPTTRTHTENLRREQQRDTRTTPHAEHIDMTAFDTIHQPSATPDVFNNSFQPHQPPRPPTYSALDPFSINPSIASPPPAYFMADTGDSKGKKHDQWGKDMDL
ncbi:hypothetical protein ACF0H5_022496 [Mactra antiquata]